MGYTYDMLSLGTSGFSYDDLGGQFLSSRYAQTGMAARVRELESMTEKAFIFANNHWQAQAVGTIRQLRLMLD